MKMKKIWEDFLLKTENDGHPIESFKPICGNIMSFMGIRAKDFVQKLSYRWKPSNLAWINDTRLIGKWNEKNVTV